MSTAWAPAGGSIAWFDVTGTLKVVLRALRVVLAPPVITWAERKPPLQMPMFILGYVNPDHFLGGRMKLRRDWLEKSDQRENCNSHGNEHRRGSRPLSIESSLPYGRHGFLYLHSPWFMIPRLSSWWPAERQVQFMPLYGPGSVH